MPSRPKRLTVGPAIARAIRGPKRGAPRCWYWQAQVEEGGTRRTLWSGWATRKEVQEIVENVRVPKGAGAAIDH